MKKLKIYILKKIVASFLNKQCPMTVQTSGVEALSVNCYYAYICFKSEPILLIRGLNDRGVFGKFYNGASHCGDACIPFDWINLSNILVIHQYKEKRFEYRGLLDYCLNGFTKKNICHANFCRIYKCIIQFFFKRKKLFMVQRHKLLKVLVQNHIESTHKGIDTIDLMTKLYSINWVVHPKGDEVETELRLYLESLIETGEISKVNTEYVVNGKSINTIEAYEHAERRHQDNVKFQRRMILLTIILVIFALVQADVIKLSTLIDLSNLK